MISVQSNTAGCLLETWGEHKQPNTPRPSGSGHRTTADSKDRIWPCLNHKERRTGKGPTSGEVKDVSEPKVSEIPDKRDWKVARSGWKSHEMIKIDREQPFASVAHRGLRTKSSWVPTTWGGAKSTHQVLHFTKT